MDEKILDHTTMGRVPPKIGAKFERRWEETAKWNGTDKMSGVLRVKVEKNRIGSDKSGT
jgi:hypothetical protein